ncbi:hypothetical protein Baya_8464 [Bagarius yarrelli]|uniref:Uncharacterized protein n=1 Tax=Bagarius yarrelli TaxID=175774 RepID=A0A556U5Q6_BAGYA|nr:hypothetical protein Baya_8464 [Bagarius yarrelli]
MVSVWRDDLQAQVKNRLYRLQLEPCNDKAWNNASSVVTVQLPGRTPRCEIKDTSPETKLSTHRTLALMEFCVDPGATLAALNDWQPAVCLDDPAFDGNMPFSPLQETLKIPPSGAVTPKMSILRHGRFFRSKNFRHFVLQS